MRTSISKAKEFLQNINDVDGTFAEHQSDCDEIINKIKHHTKRAKKGEQQPGKDTALESLVDNLRKKHESMKSAWSKIIQCAIDRENPTVFHEISVRVWATSDSVNAAIAEAKRAINSQETHGRPQRGKTHAPAEKEGKEEVRAYTKNAIKIDNGIGEQSAEKTTEAIEQNESAKTATHKNITDAGGEGRGVKESSKVTYGTEGDKTVGNTEWSETDGQEKSEITEEQSHKGARIPIRKETQAKNGHAVEKRDNAVERGGGKENKEENPRT